MTSNLKLLHPNQDIRSLKNKLYFRGTNRSGSWFCLAPLPSLHHHAEEYGPPDGTGLGWKGYPRMWRDALPAFRRETREWTPERHFGGSIVGRSWRLDRSIRVASVAPTVQAYLSGALWHVFWICLRPPTRRGEVWSLALGADDAWLCHWTPCWASG